MANPRPRPGARGGSVASLASNASELNLAPAAFQVRLEYLLEHLLDPADAPAPWRRLDSVVHEVIVDLFAVPSS